MAKKTKKRKLVDRENLSPLAKLKLNKKVESTELLLSGDELEAFKKLSQQEKREVVQEVLRKAAITAVDNEIVGYFKRINATEPNEVK